MSWHIFQAGQVVSLYPFWLFNHKLFSHFYSPPPFTLAILSLTGRKFSSMTQTVFNGGGLENRIALEAPIHHMVIRPRPSQSRVSHNGIILQWSKTLNGRPRISLPAGIPKQAVGSSVGVAKTEFPFPGTGVHPAGIVAYRAISAIPASGLKAGVGFQKG